jgi:lipoprotein-anchoring transpeptidase ErfK/SrfK
MMPAPTTVPPTTVPPTSRLSSAPATPPAPAPAPAPLGPGSSGAAVLALQQRLTSMGYWMGAPDGHFGNTTTQAVYALQKAAGLGRDGLVGPATSAAIAQGVVPHPRSTSGHVIEVDLQRDLLMLVSDGKLQYVLNTSTGGGYTYTDQGTTSVADTPVGQFHVFRQVDGMVTNSLGQLWRPKFFDGGFAVHGDSDVPPYPVSHGCARVSNEAIDWIWSNNLAPIGTEVWVY